MERETELDGQWTRKDDSKRSRKKLSKLFKFLFPSLLSLTLDCAQFSKPGIDIRLIHAALWVGNFILVSPVSTLISLAIH